MNFGLLLTTIFVGMLLPSCSSDLPEEVEQAYNELPQALDFNIHVKPILSDKCFKCHGPDKAQQKAGLRLDLSEGAYSELPNSPGKFPITPGSLRNSELFHRILSQNTEELMPPPDANLELSPLEKATLIKWIEEGAEYKPHWAFTKPEKKDIPEVANAEWVKTPVDHFVLKQLENKKLDPSPEAKKELLLRRLSFDLTGLPPTTEEIAAFLSDNSANAYEKQVDRLLVSQHYGEKMATDWMDLARYADTHGYQVDRYRDTSPWRDWVIKSFNENMPYDQFITWQLAGDLLPNPTREQRLATSFNRLHPQNLEGGIIDEEFRVAYVSDRADVVGQGFMGLTMACAKCHDHKFDPISQKNYYELYSFFNNINESGQISWDDAMPVPTMLIPTTDQEKIIDFIEKEVHQKENDLREAMVSSTSSFEQWVSSADYRTLSKRNFPKGMMAHFELENTSLSNKLNSREKGKMDRQFSAKERPNLVSGKNGNGLLLDGDAWIDFGKIGIFKRNQPFSVGLNVFIPRDLKTGVLFHKGIGARLNSFRGYHLMLKDNKLELMLAHTWPDNAIVEYSLEDVPKEQWLQITLTYDGSSKAAGLKVYMNGRHLDTRIENDNLYKEIVFNAPKDGIEPGLQIGARWRGKGLGGAIVDDIIVYDRQLCDLEVKQIADPEQFIKVTTTLPQNLTDTDSKMLKAYYLNNYSKSYQHSIQRLTNARKSLVDTLEKVKEVMVMKEMPEGRKSYILERGLYDAHGEEVSPSTPESILPMPEELPKNRLGLANWLTKPEHPLVARVAVNRYWQNYFGRGLVKSSGDFGNQGELPSHPHLLDWLALEFIESGWNIKALQKLIVMSATYRQNSETSKELREIDSENIWLARGPAVRLTGEMLRDNALAASGLLNDKIGGESVRPYQPKDIWKLNGDTYVQDTGDKLYRRSLYTIWKRTVPHPTLSTFDQPERSECTVKRQKTNTPLQALVLLNDPTYIESARVMGERISKMEDLSQGISDVFVNLTGRVPNEEELKILLELQQEEHKKFISDSKKSIGWLTSGEYRIDKNLDHNLVAANAVVASVIMNSDATITKR